MTFEGISATEIAYSQGTISGSLLSYYLIASNTKIGSVLPSLFA